MHCLTICRKFDIATESRNFCKGDLKLFHLRPKVGGGSVHLTSKGSSFTSLSGTCGPRNGSRAYRASPLRAIEESSHGEGSPFRGDEEQEKLIPTSAQKSEHYWALRILTEVALIWRSLQYSSIRFDYWLASLQTTTTNRGKYLRTSTRERSSLQTKAREEAHGAVAEGRRFRSRQRSGREQQERYVEFRDELRGDDSRYISSHGNLQRASSLTVNCDKQACLDRSEEPMFLLDLSRAFLVHRLLFKKLKKALPQLEERTKGFAVLRLLSRLSKTYGTPFMFLVVLGYFTQGFRCFPWLAMSYYFKDTLQVAPGTMQFLISTATLPMVAKPIYGIISDSIFIRGSHRVPYLTIAGVLQFLSWGAIVLHPGVSSSVIALTFILMLSNVGAAISEVMNDALVAEAGKRKKGAQQGELQSLAWLALASGGLVGNLMGGYALQRIGFEAMFCLFMMLVGAQLLVCVSVKEGSFGLRHPKIGKDDLPVMFVKQQEHGLLIRQKSQKRRIYSRTGYTTLNLDTVDHRDSSQAVGALSMTLHGWHGRVTDMFQSFSSSAEGKPILSSMQQQVSTLGNLLQNPEIIRPLLWFLSSYAIIPSLGSSLFFFQTQHLGLDSSVVGLARVVGQMGLMAGSVIYNKALKDVSLRKVFASAQILLALCMLSDILLVNRVNLWLGIPDKYFVLGASAFVDAISQFKILPFLVLLARLCPPGNEGSLLAFFMSAHCLTCTLSAYFGVGLASFLQISATSFTGLPLGIFIQAIFAMLPVIWINFIPEAETSMTDMFTER